MRPSRVGRGDQPPWTRCTPERVTRSEPVVGFSSICLPKRCVPNYSTEFRALAGDFFFAVTASSTWCTFAQYFPMIGKPGRLCAWWRPRSLIVRTQARRTHRRLRGDIPQQVVDDDGHAGHDRRCRRTDHPGVGATGGGTAEASSPKPPTLSYRSCRRSSPPVADEGWLGDPAPIAPERSPRRPAPDGSPDPRWRPGRSPRETRRHRRRHPGVESGRQPGPHPAPGAADLSGHARRPVLGAGRRVGGARPGGQRPDGPRENAGRRFRHRVGAGRVAGSGRVAGRPGTDRLWGIEIDSIRQTVADSSYCHQGRLMRPIVAGTQDSFWQAKRR